MDRVELDGAQGEGGGQILRTALTLSMITGRAFRIGRIRARRTRPGLLRQHLTAVNAAAAICAADVQGAEAGSQALGFAPGRVRGGDYRFAIGTAGSCSLVLQTVLPALWFADEPSRVAVTGGTHNPGAPPADFLAAVWQPLMRRMGVDMHLELVRHGFYPAGGGEIRAAVSPVRALTPLKLAKRGAPLGSTATAILAGLPGEIGRRELDRLGERLGPIASAMRVLPAGEGPGNALLVEVRHERVTELFTGFGEKGVRAERVADRLAAEVRQYLASPAACGEHLADQLAVPVALAGAGCFSTVAASSHLETNLAVIGAFLPARFTLAETGGSTRVTLGPA